MRRSFPVPTFCLSVAMLATAAGAEPAAPASPLSTLHSPPVAAAGAEPAAPVDPAVYVCDVPEASVVAAPNQPLPKPDGWVRLDEDDRGHRFAGSPVLMNDKIIAVFSKGSADVDVYCRQSAGSKRCARLEPVCRWEGDNRQSPSGFSVTVRENSRSAAAIEVELRAPGGQSRRITYALDAGAAFLKTTAGEGVQALRVKSPCRYAVLPDFFGDDMLVDAAAIPVGQAEIPSENFLLHMIPGGEAIVMTVSESRENDVAVTLSDASPRQIAASEVSYGKKARIWVAVLAGPGIWHDRAVCSDDADKKIELDWKMPFPALWRVDWIAADKMTESWEMLLQQPDGKYVIQNWFDQNETVGQSFGKEFGDRDWNKPGRKRWNPVLGMFSFPCWVESDGRGWLQPLKQRRYGEGGPVCNFAGPVVIYPLDRAKAAALTTPPDKLTVVDLMRMTLGVGPCQYILDLEGQKRNTRGVATCYARDVINAIYKAGTQLQHRADIEEQLEAAVAFITTVRERIDLYEKFGRDTGAYLGQQKQRDPRSAAFCDEMLAVTGRLDHFFAQKKEKICTPAYARQCAEDFRQRLLTATGEDAFKQCAAQMAKFTSIGGAQDSLVASCRMVVKTLRQRAGIALATKPELRAVATEIRARTQAILRNPTPYEAPRH